MPESKPIIGILASHDSPECNKDLVNVLDFLVEHHPEFVKSFQFAVTRGTYRRVLMGEQCEGGVNQTTRDTLLETGILRLPCKSHGGVVLLADLIVKRKVKIVWPFLTPVTGA